MAFKKIRNDGYIADTKEDLKLIREKDMGAECYVIKEASEYKLMSNGEWVKQTSTEASSNGIDTSDFATKVELEEAINNIQIPSVDGLASESFVEEKIAEIKMPSIEGLASEIYVDEAVAGVINNPLFKTFASPDMPSSGHLFGIYLEATEGKTLIEKMMETGLGMYNFWVGKGAPGQPEEVVTKNSSCRGLCCYDTANGTGGKYGWIIMFDHDGDVYVQYIRDGEAKGWKRFMTV